MTDKLKKMADEVSMKLAEMIEPWLNRIIENPGETYSVALRPVIEKALLSAREEAIKEAAEIVWDRWADADAKGETNPNARIHADTCYFLNKQILSLLDEKSRK